MSVAIFEIQIVDKLIFLMTKPSNRFRMQSAAALFEFWTFRHRDVSAPFIQIVLKCHFYGIKHILVQVPNRRGAETSCTQFVALTLYAQLNLKSISYPRVVL